MSKYNNAETTLAGDLQASGMSFIVKSGEGDLFPSTFPYKITLEQYEGVNVKKREILTISWKSIDAFTISARASETCVQDDTANPKVRTAQALSFLSGSRVFMGLTEEGQNALETEVFTNIPNTFATKDEVKKWSLVYDASSTGTDDYAINITGLTTYADGEVFRVKADVANTWPATLNVNGLWAIPLKKWQWTVDLTDNDIKAGGIFTAVYNSTLNTFQFAGKEATVVSSSPYVFWNWSDGDLVLDGSNNVLVADKVYNFKNLTIPAGQTLSLSWQWNLIIHCTWTVDISWTIDVSWKWYWWTVKTQLEMLWISVTSWSSWTGGNGWAWTYYNWAGWLWANGYGWWWGGGWFYYWNAMYWWAGWTGWSPAGLWGSLLGANAYWNNGGNWYNYNWYANWWAGWNSAGGGWATRSYWIGGGWWAGWSAWNNWSNIIIICDNIIWSWTIITNGAVWQAGGVGGYWYALNWTAWQGGWWWGGGWWAGGSALIVYNTSSLTETFTSNWANWWAGGAGGAGWTWTSWVGVAWTAGWVGWSWQIIKKQLYTLI